MSDVTDRLDKLEAALKDNQLPASMAVLKRKLEQDWQPDAAVLLQAGSITSDMLAKDATARGPYTTPARAFATTYQPNVSRPTLVIATYFISMTATEGSVTVLCDAASPPTTAIAVTAARNLNAANVYVQQPVTFIVPAGYYYRLVTANLTGVPAFVYVQTAELTL